MFSLFRKKRVYLDYASTTPLDSRVFDAMSPYLKDKFANPASLYKEGTELKKIIDESRKKVASIVQAKPEEIIFTSGGTESNNLAILGTYFYHKNILKKEVIHFVTTTIEHSSVLEVFEHIRSLGGKVTYISPERNGIVNVKKIEEAIRQETVMVSVMYVNNEIGTIQPIRGIGRMLKEKNMKVTNTMMPIVFHSDACQTEYIPILVNDLCVDFLTLDGSKIYGPKSSGVLFKKRSVKLEPIILGGGQENGLRSGTENVSAIVGFTKAFEICNTERIKEIKRIKILRDDLLENLLKKIPKLILNGDKEKRIPNNINICLPRLDAEYTVLRLDALGFAVSSVTSCKNLSEDSSSYVIEELYGDDSCSKSSLRITLGRYTTKKECEDFMKTICDILHNSIDYLPKIV